jgi:hypothetical protein
MQLLMSACLPFLEDLMDKEPNGLYSDVVYDSLITACLPLLLHGDTSAVISQRLLNEYCFTMLHYQVYTASGSTI